MVGEQYVSKILKAFQSLTDRRRLLVVPRSSLEPLSDSIRLLLLVVRSWREEDGERGE
jgi:hypothetical protein